MRAELRRASSSRIGAETLSNPRCPPRKKSYGRASKASTQAVSRSCKLLILFFKVILMSANPAHVTKNKLAKMYAIGIVVFSGVFGFLTLFAVFLANLK